MQLELVGGPFDGAELERSKRPAPFVWVNAEGRMSEAPRDGAHLYRVFGAKNTVFGILWRYRFAGFETTRCDACGWIGPFKDGECLLCGASLPVQQA